MRTITDRIKEVLEEIGKSQNWLDKQIGKSSGYLSNVAKRLRERGGKDSPRSGPNTRPIQKAADVLGVHLEWLLDEIGPKWNKPAQPYGSYLSWGEAVARAKTLPAGAAISEAAWLMAERAPARVQRAVYEPDDAIKIAQYLWLESTEDEKSAAEDARIAVHRRSEGKVTQIRPITEPPATPKGRKASGKRVRGGGPAGTASSGGRAR